MPALQQLTAIEPQLESAFVEHFEARSVYQVLRRTDSRIAKATRLDIGVTLGEAVQNAKTNLTWPDGKKTTEYARRSFELEAIWSTERAKDSQEGEALTLHDQGVAMIRAALMAKFTTELNARLPFHVIPFAIRELGCAYEIDERSRADRTVFRASGFVDIRADATTVTAD